MPGLHARRDAFKSHSIEWLFAVLVVPLLLAGCDRQLPGVQLSGPTMGTIWRLTAVTGPGQPSAGELKRGIEAQLEAVNRSMSTYRSDSEITAVNDVESGEWVSLSPAFYSVLSAALEVGARSEGAYDVTVAPLVELWGFGPAGPVPEPPADVQVQQVLELIGQRHIELDRQGQRMRKRRPVSLDFSSIAKGFAVDRVADWLLQQGVERFLVEVGGELRLAGLSPRGDLWRIAIESPDSAMQGIAGAIALTDQAVATSGDYRNFFEVEGRRFSHSLDPRTGYPVAHELVSVTVVHPSAMLADAWATALTVLGPERALSVAQAGDLAVYFIQREGEGFSSRHTPAFERFLPAGQGTQLQ